MHLSAPLIVHKPITCDPFSHAASSEIAEYVVWGKVVYLEIGSSVDPLSTTLVVLIHFISRLKHSYWERNVGLNIKISKFVVSN